MNDNNKKSLKKTNAVQFQKLMGFMDEFPHLATGTPTFGGSRAAMEHTWDNVAQRLNAHGPPERNGGEWKKVWQDQKCRLKKKISENNKSLHVTGGGPCVINNLTPLELDIDRICHLSSAAAPSGKIFGVPNATKKMACSSSSHKISLHVTPPRSCTKVAVVTPTSSDTLNQIFTPNVLLAAESPTLPRSHEILLSSTPYRIHQKKMNSKPANVLKRKINEKSSEKHEQLKLLKKQIEIQENSVEAMKAQAEATRACADAMKAQAEISKTILDVLKAQAASNQAQAEVSRASLDALKAQAESTQVIAQALVDIVKHLKDED